MLFHHHKTFRILSRSELETRISDPRKDYSVSFRLLSRNTTTHCILSQIFKPILNLLSVAPFLIAATPTAVVTPKPDFAQSLFVVVAVAVTYRLCFIIYSLHHSLPFHSLLFASMERRAGACVHGTYSFAFLSLNR